MKCSLGISNFLEEISSLSHSFVFLYIFASISEEGFLISSCSSLELCIQMLISFLFSFAFRFSSFHLSTLDPVLYNKGNHRCEKTEHDNEASAPGEPAWQSGAAVRL